MEGRSRRRVGFRAWLESRRAVAAPRLEPAQRSDPRSPDEDEEERKRRQEM